MQPLFSIIIPTYNSASTLYVSLQSIASQQCQDYEVLIMDGISTDDTLKIAASFEHKILIKIISEKDKGIYDAMNKGIAMASGKWLYFLGSDDRFFDTEVLQKIKVVINTSPEVEVVYGNVLSERFKGLYGGEFDAKKILKNNISHQAIFFRKTVFEKTGLFDLKYKAQSDWDHNLKWMLDENIIKKFTPVTVADYADGGFSSQHGDAIFYADLNFNYIRYGKRSISFSTKIKLLMYEFFKSIKRMEMQRFKKVLAQLKYI